MLFRSLMSFCASGVAYDVMGVAYSLANVWWEWLKVCWELLSPHQIAVYLVFLLVGKVDTF